MTHQHTTSGKTIVRAGLALSTVLLILGVAGCDDTSGAGSSPSADETYQDEGESGGASSPGAEETDSSEQVSLSVEPVGEGPYGLVTSETPEAAAQEVSGELIIGPGSYLAVVQDDQPQLIVFGEGAEFTLREDRPSVTTPELGTLEVGQQVELSTVEVPRDDVSGLSQSRIEGAADTVLVVVG